MKSSLFVAGLDYSMTNEELVKLFSQYGTVVLAKIVSDQYSGASKGFGFVEMSSNREAADCISNLNGTMQKGRQIVVKEKEDKPSNRSSYGSRNNNRRGW